MELRAHPLFICGLPRSGTTLLQSLFDGHPELVVDVVDSRFFTSFVPRAQGCSGVKREALAREILLARWNPDKPYYQSFLNHIPLDAVHDGFRKRVAASERRAPDYLTAAILAIGDASGQMEEGVRYWVEKTPGNEHYAQRIYTWWPEAKCIHLLRDPRDVFATLKKRAVRAERRLPTPGKVAYIWGETVDALERNVATYGDDHYVWLRYEDLVLDTEAQLSRIVAFTGISDHDTLRIPTKGAGRHSWKGNSVDKTFSGISARAVGRWRGYLSAREVAVLESLLGSRMERYGYEREGSSSLGARMRALPHRMVNVARRVRALLRSR